MMKLMSVILCKKSIEFADGDSALEEEETVLFTIYKA